MLTLFVQTLWESVHRRVALAMIVVATLVAGGFIYFTHFVTVNGKLLIVVRQSTYPADMEVREQLSIMLNITSGPWIFLGLFAVAPLLCSHFEKGWAELLFAKGVARWQIVTARLAGATCVFALTVLLLCVVPGSYLAWRADVALQPFFVSLLLVLLSFVAFSSVMLLVSTSQPNPAALIAVGFVQMILSQSLFNRQAMYGIITWKWAQSLIDWTYRILPKNAELSLLGSRYLRQPTEFAWWPVWSTAVFTVAAFAWSYWRIERRAI